MVSTVRDQNSYLGTKITGLTFPWACSNSHYIDVFLLMWIKWAKFSPHLYKCNPRITPLKSMVLKWCKTSEFRIRPIIFTPVMRFFFVDMEIMHMDRCSLLYFLLTSIIDCTHFSLFCLLQLSLSTHLISCRHLPHQSPLQVTQHGDHAGNIYFI